MESLFAYTDYRRYLSDAFQAKKLAVTGFSLRTFAEETGFKARDFLLRVMRGERNLSAEGAGKLSRFFGFSEKQAAYFQALVHFNQAETTPEKERLYRKLSEIRRYGSQQRLRRDQFEYLSVWHHSALRSLLPILEPGEDWKRIARRFDPPLTAKQARDSAELLLRLGLLHRNGRGRYAVAQPSLGAGDEVASVAVAGFHKSSMDLARRSIDRHPAAARDFSGLTMSISQAGFRRIKAEIQSLRKKIAAIATDDSEEDMVYQLNLQLFPLTRARGRA